MEYLRSIFMKPGGSSSFFEVFFHHPFILSPSFRSFTFVLLVLAQLDCFFPFLRLTSVCWFVSQITSRENVTLLVPAMNAAAVLPPAFALLFTGSQTSF